MATHHDPVTGRMSEPANLVRVACAMASIMGFPEVHEQNHPPAGTLPDTLKIRPELAPDRLREQINRQLASVGTV
jgi:hypothetical protein